MNNTIKIEKLNVKFQNQIVLKDISFKVYANKPLCIIGKGSSAKTTLIKSILGLIPLESGEIIINDFSLLKKKNIFDDFGVVFQNDALFDSLTVFENIMFRKLHFNSRKDIIKECYELLKMVDLDNHVANLLPYELSGGMKKRVAIARAISIKPKFLFLDEPTAGLDPIKTNKIFQIISDFSKKMGITIVAVSSDVKGVLKYFDEILLLKDKKICWKGSTKDIKKSKNKHLQEFFQKVIA